MKKLPFNFRLRHMLIVPFIVPIVASTALVGWFSFQNGQQAIRELTQKVNVETGSRIKEHILSYLHKSQNTLWLTEAGVKSNNFRLDDFDKLYRYFWEVVKKGDFEAYLAYANEQGEFLGVDHKENGTIELKIQTVNTGSMRQMYLLDDQGNIKKFLREAEFDPRQRPWYKAAKNANQPTWSEIYASSSSKNTALQITPVRPIYDENGQFLGVLSINILLSRITGFINDLYISPKGQSFIMERSGELVASSKMKQPFKVTKIGDEHEIKRIVAGESEDPVIMATVTNLQRKFGSLYSIHTIQNTDFFLEKERYFATVLPISDTQGIDWLAVIIVPESDFMQQINANNRMTIFLCFLTLIGATGIGVFNSGLITQKMQKLTQASKDLAHGNLNRRVERTDQVIEIEEIETLEQSFNKMAGQLQEAFETLEDKVQERTVELATANEEILALNERLKEENLRMGAELNVARQIQQMILPKPEELENIEGLDIAGYMKPADEVGGDYYDVLETDGIVTFAIGDVTGHGLESGILMLMTQTAVRTLQEIHEMNPVIFLDTINRTIYKNVQRMRSGKSLSLAIINYTDGKISISGQHEEILIVRKGGIIERIDTIDLGFPIGLDEKISDFISHAIFWLNPEDGIVLYTDGITEALNLNKEHYKVERLCEVISKSWYKSSSEIRDDIIKDLQRHIGKQKVFDDITLLVLKREGEKQTYFPSHKFTKSLTV